MNERPLEDYSLPILWNRITELEATIEKQTRQITGLSTNHSRVVEGRDNIIEKLQATIEQKDKRIAELEANVHLAFYEGHEYGLRQRDSDIAWDSSDAKSALDSGVGDE